MMKKSTSWTVLAYGLVLSGLGYLGYYRTGSMISVISGGSFGLLIVISALLMFRSIRAGSYMALSTSAVLTVLFSVRFSLTGKTIPAVLAILSAFMLIFLLKKTTKWKR